MSNKPQQSILNRLKLIMGTIVFLLVTTAIIIVVLHTESNKESDRIESINSITNIMARLIQRPLSQNDYIAVETLVQAQDLPSYILNLEVRDSSGEVIANSFRQPKACDSTTQIENYISANTSLTESSQIGSLVVSASLCDLRDQVIEAASIAVIIGIFLFFIFTFLIEKGLKAALLPLTNTVSRGSQISPESFSKEIVQTSPIEILPLMQTFQENIELSLKGRLADEVFHDIVSPLVAAENYLFNLSEEHEISSQNYSLLLKRIRRPLDMLNSLRRSNVKGLTCDYSYLDILVENIIAEKNVLYSEKVEFTFDRKRSDFGCYANISEDKLSRIISNCLDNSFESITSDSSNSSDGRCHVTVQNFINNIRISIYDNGSGVPYDLTEKVFEQGFSTKPKASNSGIGLSTARKWIEEANGSIQMYNLGSGGSKIDILIPQFLGYSKYLRELQLTHGQTIVIVDDEEDQLQLLTNILPKQIKILHLKNRHELSKYISKSNLTNEIFLFDYHFHHQDYKGTDLISEFSLQDRSILATSMAESEEVQRSASELSVKILPKILISHIPVKIESLKDLDSSKSATYFLDDDALLCKAAEKIFCDIDTRFFSFSKARLLLDATEDAHKDSVFVLDSNLGNDEFTGEEIALTLSKKGFSNIYLSTGYDKSRFSHLPYVKKVLEKSPPAKWRSQLMDIASRDL